MLKHASTSWLLVLAGLSLSTVAHAGRPMTTDDASITPAGECQMQSWLQHASAEDELWMLPACSPFSRLEITAGGAEHWNGSSNGTLWSAQAKFLLRDEAPGEWGAAISIGWNRRHSAAPEDRVDAQPFNVVTSYRASDEAFAVHLNLGMRHDDAQDSTRTTWGAAYERAPAARLGEFVEVFGATGTSPTLQTGIRYDIVSDRISINGTVGAVMRDGLREPFVTVGLNL